MDLRLERIKEVVEKELSCSAHDLEHTNRVFNLAMRISANMTVDHNILLPAIFLHDIARARVDRSQGEKIDHAILGSQMAKVILEELAYEDFEIEQICHCIENHRFRTKSEERSIEAQVLYDADKLESLGAIGIARSYIMVGQYGAKIFSEYDAEKIESHLIEKAEKHAPNIEFQIKYKNLAEKLYTSEAKKIAYQRSQFMAMYFEQLEKEVNDIL